MYLLHDFVKVYMDNKLEKTMNGVIRTDLLHHCFHFTKIDSNHEESIVKQYFKFHIDIASDCQDL